MNISDVSTEVFPQGLLYMGLHSSLWFSHVATLAVYSNGWVNAAVYSWQNRHICCGLRDMNSTDLQKTLPLLGWQNLGPIKKARNYFLLLEQWYTCGKSCCFAARRFWSKVPVWIGGVQFGVLVSMASGIFLGFCCPETNSMAARPWKMRACTSGRRWVD